MAEQVLYNQGGIRVTTARAVFPEATYPLAGITAVGKVVVPASRGGLVLAGALVAFALLLFSTGELTLLALAPLAGATYFGYRSLQEQPRYAVTISTAGGQVRALVSDSERLVDEVRDALDRAVVERG